MLLENIQYSKNKLLFFLRNLPIKEDVSENRLDILFYKHLSQAKTTSWKKLLTTHLCLPQTNHRFSQLLGAFSPHFLEQRASGKKSCRTSVESRFRQRFWLRALATNSKMGTLAHVLRKKNKPQKTVEKRSKKKQRTREPRRKGRRNQEEQEKKQSEREKPSALLEAARSSGGKEEKKEETDRKKKTSKKTRKRNKKTKKNAQKKKKKERGGRERCWAETCCSLSSEPYDAMTYSP